MIALVVARTAGGTGRHVRALAAAIDDAVVVGPRFSEDAFRFSEVARWTRDPRMLRDAALVHAHGMRAAVLASIVVPRRTPFVVTWHNRVSPRWTELERRVARRATVSLCVSSDLADRAKALGGNDVRLAPVGARRPGPVRDAADVRAALGVGDRPLVVAAGRLTEQKGYDLLLDAATQYEVRTPRPATVIAGDGPLRGQLADAVARRGLDVTLLGPRDDVPDLFAAADVVVLPSRWEGSPLTAHEALFSGTPLVATAVGGLPDLLGGGAAALVPAGDARTFADAVLRLLDHPDEAVAQAASGRARAEQWPDEDEAVRRVLALYAALLA